MRDRDNIPAKLRREILVEAGHRCAIPTCKHPTTEIAHIIPWDKVKKHEFANLIALCPNCHTTYDLGKKIDIKSMKIYKANLSLLRSRYIDFEVRVLQFFLGDPNETFIRLPGLSDLQVYYLVSDGFLAKTNQNSGIVSDGVPTWEWYAITELGRDFIKGWSAGTPLV